MNDLRLAFRLLAKSPGLTAGAGLLLALSDVAAVRAAEAPTAPRIDWAGDLAVFRRELPARHKDLFFHTDRATFERNVAALERDVPHLSDTEVALRLQEIIAAMGDDHSGVVLPPRPGAAASMPVPLSLHWFADGWRVIATDRATEHLLTCKVTALGGGPMPEVEARVARLLSPDNPWLVKSRLPQAVVQAAVLRHCGLATDLLVVTAESPEGAPREAKLPLEPAGAGDGRVQFRPKKVAEAYSNQRAILWHKVLPAERIFYLQYNRCEGREVAERRGDTAAAARLPSLTELFATALAALRTAVEQGQAHTLVVDVRFNPGGASDFGTRFAEQVAEIAPLREPGRVYVIIGRRTFSSAILNALDFKRLLGARFVGEPTSGTANHYGEVKTFTLPSSGAVVSYSTKYFGATEGRLDPLRPDLAAELSFADYAAGIDPALEAIKAATRVSARSAALP